MLMKRWAAIVKALALLCGFLASIFLFVLLIQFIVQKFPLIAVLLLPVYIYIFYRVLRGILKRRKTGIDDTDYGRFSPLRYEIQMIVEGLGFLILVFGMMYISEVVAMIIMGIAMMLGMYRMLEIGEDIKGDVMAHMHETDD